MGHRMKKIGTSFTVQMAKAQKAFMKTMPATVAAPHPRESKVDKDWHSARTALDKAECLVHEAKNAKTLKAAIKKMDCAQKHMNVVYRAHEKAGR